MFLSCSVVRVTMVLGALSTAVNVCAQTNNAYIQDAAVVGSTNQISITRLPVVANGVTYYWDVTLPIEVGAGGVVSVGTLSQVKSPTLITSAFRPGTYNGPPTVLNGKGQIVITGPGLYDGKYTQWTINTTAQSDPCTYPGVGTFYVGPLTSNPIYSRLKAANITSTAWSYGAASSGGCFQDWSNNGIIGVSQVGNTLTIASFTIAGNDTNTPVDQIIYTLLVP